MSDARTFWVQTRKAEDSHGMRCAFCTHRREELTKRCCAGAKAHRVHLSGRYEKGCHTAQRSVRCTCTISGDFLLAAVRRCAGQAAVHFHVSEASNEFDKTKSTLRFKYRSMDVLKATRIVADPDARIATPAYVSLLEDADSPVPSFPLTPPFYEYEGNHRIYDVDGSDAWHAPTPRQSPQIPLPRTTPQAPAQVIDVRKRVRMQSKLVGPVVKMEPREPRLPPSTAGMTIDLTQDDD